MRIKKNKNFKYFLNIKNFQFLWLKNLEGFLKDKRGIDVLNNTLVFLLLNVIFFAIMFGFVARAGSGATVVEQVYAKQIALIIDQAKPGTNININIEEVYELADKNKFSRQNVIKIDNEKNKVYVQVDKGRGYSYNFFNSAEVVWELKKIELFLGVK